MPLTNITRRSIVYVAEVLGNNINSNKLVKQFLWGQFLWGKISWGGGGVFSDTQEQSSTHRNQPTDLQSKSIDWFLYEIREAFSPVKNVYINGLIQNVMA